MISLNSFRVGLLEVAAREAILEEAAKTASLDWLVNFAVHCVVEHEPRKPEHLDWEPLTSAEAAERLQALALARVEEAAADGALVELPDLVSKLFHWRDLIGKGGIERVHGWLAKRLADNAVVIALARSFVSDGWTQAAGDVVTRRYRRVDRDAVEALVDPDAFKTRIAELLANPDIDANARDSLKEFQAAWTRSPHSL